MTAPQRISWEIAPSEIYETICCQRFRWIFQAASSPFSHVGRALLIPNSHSSLHGIWSWHLMYVPPNDEFSWQYLLGGLRRVIDLWLRSSWCKHSITCTLRSTLVTPIYRYLLKSPKCIDPECQLLGVHQSCLGVILILLSQNSVNQTALKVVDSQKSRRRKYTAI